MRQKWLLGFGAVAVVAMVIYLLVSLRDGAAGPATTGGTASSPTATGSSGGGEAGGATSTAPPPTAVAPEVKRPQPPPPVEDTSPEVRDHRGAGASGQGTPSPIIPATIGTVRKALTASVRSCGEQLDIETQRVRFAAHAKLRAGGGRLSAHDVTVTGAEALGPAFADCVKRAYEGLAVEAVAEQPDGEDTVHMPWTVP